MEGTLVTRKLEGYTFSVYLPREAQNGVSCPAACVLAGEDFAKTIPQVMEGLEPEFGSGLPPFLLASLSPVDWNYDYTPWPEEALPGRDGMFDGGADIHLRFWTDAVVPYLRREFSASTSPNKTALLGYSLGGLAALYALYQTNVFGRIASISGSLWYPGFVDYAAEHPPKLPGARVYLSLGESEERTHNPLLSTVGSCTRSIEQLLSRQLKQSGQVFLEWNKGGHFTGISGRFQKALRWLMMEGGQA